nr:MFS transporter [Brevibacillus invocatus]
MYGIGFLILGSNVALFNYMGYVLTAPPYRLSQTLVGWIFIVYLVGTVSSVWMAKWADKYGRQNMMILALTLTLVGVCITLETHLWVKMIGLPVLVFGFFGSHSIASAWVGRRSRIGRRISIIGSPVGCELVEGGKTSSGHDKR